MTEPSYFKLKKMKLEQSRRKAERCAQDRAMTWTNHTNNSYPEQMIRKLLWYSGNYAVSLSIISLHVDVTFLDQLWWIWKQLQLVCGWVDVGWMDIYPYINMLKLVTCKLHKCLYILSISNITDSSLSQ